METTPIISVIIPTYNRGNIVPQAIESALNQTYKNFEIIVVDDGSTDNTKETLGRYYDKIKFFYKNNGGVSSARNFGVKHALGKYIAFLDSDDLWYPDKLQRQIVALQLDSRYGLAITEVDIIDASKKHLFYSSIKNCIGGKQINTEKVLQLIYSKQYITCSYMLIKKDLFEKIGFFNETLNTAEDIDILLRMSSSSEIVLIDEPLIKYKKSLDSLSNQLFTMNRVKVLNNYQLNNPIDAIKYKKLFSRTLAKINFDYAVDLLWHRCVKEAQSQIFQSLRYQFTLKAIVLYAKSMVMRIVSVIFKSNKLKSTSKKIKVLFLNYSFDVGGIETLILAMCKGMQNNEFNLNVCSFKDSNILRNEFEQMNVPFYFIQKKEGLDIKLIFKLRKLYKVLDIDLVHTHNAAQWFYGILAGIGLSRPVIIHTQHSVLRIEERKLLYVLRLLANRTSEIVCVAKYVADYMSKEGKINDRKVEVIYNGIDVNKFKFCFDERIKKNSLGIPGEFKVVGNIARLAPIKNHKSLLEAFKIVLQQRPNTILLIAGGGVLLDELKHYSQELEIAKSVFFLGDRRDIPELLKVMDIFVLSSLSEGLSMTLLEAMSAALPIVATKVGGNSEVIEDNKTGLLVPSKSPERLAKAIIWLLDNREIAMAMGQEGQRIAMERFSIEKMITEYQNLYREFAVNSKG